MCSIHLEMRKIATMSFYQPSNKPTDMIDQPYRSADKKTMTRYDRNTMISKYEATRDTVNLSSIGKQLYLFSAGKTAGSTTNPWNFITRKTAVDEKKNAWETVTSASANEDIKLVDRHISRIGKCLERMQTLALAATDESLDDDDRILMQIQMGQLQHEINLENEAWARRYVNSPGDEKLSRKIIGVYEDSDAYKMLMRTLGRIESGEEWDVAEIAHVVMGGKNEGVFKDPILDAYAVDVLWEVTDDETVPRVGDIIRAKGRSVMDAESAAVSAARLEKDIKGMEELRERMVGFVAEKGERPEGYYGDELDNIFKVVYGYIDANLFKDCVQTTFGNRVDEQGNDFEELLKTRRIKAIRTTYEDPQMTKMIGHEVIYHDYEPQVDPGFIERQASWKSWEHMYANSNTSGTGSYSGYA